MLNRNAIVMGYNCTEIIHHFINDTRLKIAYVKSC